MKKTLVILAVCCLGLAGIASADIQYAPHVVNMRTDSNSGPIVSSGTVLLVIDLDGQGRTDTAFPWANWSPDTWLPNAGQSTLFDDSTCRLPVVNGVGDVLYNLVLTYDEDTGDPIFPTGYDAGTDRYWVVWFDTPFSASATGPGAGVHFGAKMVGTLSASDGGVFPTSTVTADIGKIYYGVTTPEPASLSLLALGGLLALRRRSRKA